MAKKKRNVNINELYKIMNDANSYFEQGKYDVVISLCETALNDYTETAEKHVLAKIYFTWVLSQMRKNDYAPINDIICRAKNDIGEYLDLTFMQVMSAYGSQEWQNTIHWAEKYLSEHEQADPAEKSYLKQSYNSIDEVLWLGGEAAKNIGDLDKTIEMMGKAVSYNPLNHLHRVEFASLTAKNGKSNQAMKILDEGIELFPNQVALKNAKGYMMGELRMYEEAEQYISELLKQYPDDTDANNNLGVIYDSQGKYDLAMEQFEKVLQVEPQNPTAKENLENLRNTVEEKYQTISAAMIVKDEENFLPQCLDSIKDLVDEIIIVDTGSTDRTMEIAREYGAKIYEHPWENDFSLHRNQSIDYATGDWILIIDADEELKTEEHATIRQAIKRKDVTSISFVVYNKIQMGRIGFLNSHRMFRNGLGFKYHGIVHNQLVVEGKTLMSQFKVIHHGYGLSEEQMEKKGRRSEALLLKQLEKNPELVFPHFNLAQIYRGLGEPDKSLEHSKFVVDNISVSDLDHRHVRLMAMDQMGCAYIGMDKFEEAESVFNEALTLRDDYLDPMFNMGFMFMRQRRYEDAERIFKQYLNARDDYRPENEWMGLILNNLSSQFAVYYALGFIEFLRNDIDKALELFLKSYELTENFEFLHHLIARCYREKGMFDKSLEHCEKAIETNNEDIEIRMIQGESYLNLNNAEKARECFNRALELDPENESARLGLIGADSLDSNPEELLKAINDFLEKSPNSPQGLVSKGDVQFDMGDYSDAKHSYQDAALKYPDDYKILNNLGNCFLKEKNFASAEVYYLMALQRNKDFFPGYRNLAITLINQERFEDAADYLEYYVRNNPGDSEIYATLGDIYYKSKNYTKAVGQFEKYINAFPSNMDAIIRLSDCYFNLGKLKAAAAGYKAVLVKQPSNEIAANRLKELNTFLKPVESQ